MKQSERRLYLIKELLAEELKYREIEIPNGEEGQKRLLRSLMNVRYPRIISEQFLEEQDLYLQEETAKKGIVDIENLVPLKKDIYLWQGDITTLKCDAIVNAANSGMTGCYVPCHRCIDNCIHTFAGIQLRNFCADLMDKQGVEEPTGQAKITPAFNLPCDYVIHTVGPIVYDGLTEKECELLKNCYQSCLEIADENDLKSIAFCCISTGEFRFPNEKAAKIAIQTIMEYKQKTNSKMKVIFNVFKEEDKAIYERLLGEIENENK